MRPGEALSGRYAAAYVALARVYERDGRATVRTVAAELGLSSSSSTHYALEALIDLGLATQEPGTHGSLRPAVTAVRLGC